MGGYPLYAMHEDDDRYWCSTQNCSDIWMTFDCENKAVSKISVQYHPSYHAKKVFVYTNATRPFAWNSGQFLKEVALSGNNMEISLASHEKFVALRFFDWINGYVGVQRVRFELNSSVNEMMPGMGDIIIASAPTMSWDGGDGDGDVAPPAY